MLLIESGRCRQGVRLVGRTQALSQARAAPALWGIYRFFPPRDKRARNFNEFLHHINDLLIYLSWI